MAPLLGFALGPRVRKKPQAQLLLIAANALPLANLTFLFFALLGKPSFLPKAVWCSI
jgi:hypothetical protein